MINIEIGIILIKTCIHIASLKLNGTFLCKLSMQPYFVKGSIGTGFKTVLNWFQSTALTTQLQLPQKNREPT